MKALLGFLLFVAAMAYFMIFFGNDHVSKKNQNIEIEDTLRSSIAIGEASVYLPFVVEQKFVMTSIYSSIINYYKIIFKNNKIQRDVFAVSIKNRSDRPIIVVANAVVEGASYSNERIVTIPPQSTDTVSVSPLFIPTYLTSLSEKELHNLEVDIRINYKDTSYVALKEEIPITLLPANIMKYFLLDEQAKKLQDIRPLLAGFVDPSFYEVDEILRLASKENENEMLVGYQDIGAKEKSEIVNGQMKALFNALRKLPITYVSNPVDYSGDQKIKSVSDVIKYESANCIEGVILFASLIEALGMHPIVVLVPGHSFVGWKSWRGSTTASFLETTMIWNVSDPSFDMALKAGEREYISAQEEGFFKSGEALSLDIIGLRDKGILPFSVGNSSY